MPRQLTVIALVLVAGLCTGWLTNGWRLGVKHEAYRRTQAELLAESQRELREAEQRFGNAVAVLDTRYTEELANAEEENNRLRADVLRGSIRLSIPATCPAAIVPNNPGTASSADAEVRADIDERAAAEILELTERGDRAIRQLSALQEYVATVCVGGDQ